MSDGNSRHEGQSFLACFSRAFDNGPVPLKKKKGNNLNVVFLNVNLVRACPLELSHLACRHAVVSNGPALPGSNLEKLSYDRDSVDGSDLPPVGSR